MSRRRWHILAAALGAAIALLVQAGSAVAQLTPRGTPAEEAPFTFHLNGIRDTVLTTLYGDSTTYLPLVQLFRYLQVEVAYDTATGRISGQYVRADRPYVLDLRNRQARVAGQATPLDSTQFVGWQEDVYVAPALLTRLFGIETSIDLPSLSIILSSSDTFPVVRAGYREFQRERSLVQQKSLAPAPLEFARSPRLLNGLMINYQVTAQAASGNSYGLTDLHAGGEVLGGDFQATLHAAGGRGPGQGITTGDALWHYVLQSKRRLLTQVSVGSLSSMGLQGVPMQGVQVTNEPLERRSVLGEQLVAGITHPEWEVELYVGDQLVAYTRADLSGRYSFNLPLSYGSTLVSIKTYGPTGGREEDQRRTEVPVTLVPARQADYTVSLGRNTQDRGALAQGRVSYGLFEALTVFSGSEYLGGRDDSKPVLYGGATARLLSSLIGSASIAPAALNQASLLYTSPSLARIQATYSDYAPRTPYNRLSIDHQLQLEGALPLDFGPFSAILNGNGSVIRFIGTGTTYDLDGQAMLNIGPARPSLGVRRSVFLEPAGQISLTNELTAGLLYFFIPGGRMGPLNATLFSSSAGYRPDQHKLERIQVALSRNIRHAGRLTVGYDWSGFSHIGQVQARYILDLPSIQTMTSVQSGPSASTALAQTIRGTTTLDPSSHEWAFSGREGVGRAGAVFRFFVDANGDGIWQKGEETIRGARIKFRQAAPIQTLRDGRLRVSDLLAYHEYSVDLDEAGIENPLWRPKYPSFSFVADPNSFKVIDVPFYAATEIEGSVREQAAGGSREIGGMTVRFRRIDHPDELTVQTFSDGSFYHPGLAPGTYVVEPDPGQLRALGLTAEPASQTLELRRTTDGVTRSGVDFLLKLPPPTESSIPKAAPQPATSAPTP